LKTKRFYIEGPGLPAAIIAALLAFMVLAGCDNGGSYTGSGGGDDPGGGSNNYYGEYYPPVVIDEYVTQRAHIYIFFDDKTISPFLISSISSGFSVTVGGVLQTLIVNPGILTPGVEGVAGYPHRIGIWFDNDLPETGDIKVSYDGSDSTINARGVPIFTNVAVERK
jgi:hypothetical protein